MWDGGGVSYCKVIILWTKYNKNIYAYENYLKIRNYKTLKFPTYYSWFFWWTHRKWLEFKTTLLFWSVFPKIELPIIKHCAITLLKVLFWPRPGSGSLLRRCWPFESRAATERLLWVWCYRCCCEARVTTPQHSKTLNSISEGPITHYWLYGPIYPVNDWQMLWRHLKMIFAYSDKLFARPAGAGRMWCVQDLLPPDSSLLHCNL